MHNVMQNAVHNAKKQLMHNIRVARTRCVNHVYACVQLTTLQGETNLNSSARLLT